MRWRRLPVDDTPLGQSLDGKVERGAVKLLDEFVAAMPTGERAAQRVRVDYPRYRRRSGATVPTSP